VTMAGFGTTSAPTSPYLGSYGSTPRTQVSSTGRIYRSGFWRCCFNWLRTGTWSTDCFTVASVWPRRGIATDNKADQVKGGGTVTNGTPTSQTVGYGFRFEGNWLRGISRNVSVTVAHCDNFQLETLSGGRTQDIYFIGNVLEHSSNACIILSGAHIGKFEFHNNFLKGAYYNAVYSGGVWTNDQSRWAINGAGKNGNGFDTMTANLTGNVVYGDITLGRRFAATSSSGNIVYGVPVTQWSASNNYGDQTWYFVGGDGSQDTYTPTALGGSATTLASLRGTLWSGECPLVVSLPGTDNDWVSDAPLPSPETADPMTSSSFYENTSGPSATRGFWDI
jgi:hypothetical protein